MSIPARITAAVVALASFGVAPGALGADPPRIAIGGVRNDPGGAIGRALAKRLCARFACVARERVVTRGRIDFAAARREGVDAVLFGTVEGPRTRRALALALLRGSIRPERTWRLPLDERGRLDAASLAAVEREIDAAVRPAAPPAPKRPPRAPADTAATAEQPSRRTEPERVAPSAPVLREPGAAPSPRSEPRPADAGAAPGAPAQVPARTAAPLTERPAVAAVDLGIGALQRRLDFQGVGASSGTLRAFSGGTLIVPSVRAEVFPWATSAGRWQAGLGAFASYSRSVGFQTEDASTGRAYDSVYASLEAGLAYRIAPLGSPRLALVPALWYRKLSFTISPASGTALAGLPDADLSGVAAGLGVELPVGDRWMLLADGSYTVWTTAKDLIGGGGYFPSGSAGAFGADAGVSVRLWGRLSLRAFATLDLTRYSLRGSGTYAATGATDRYLGARAALRVRF